MNTGVQNTSRKRAVKWGIAQHFVKDIRFWANTLNCHGDIGG